MFDTKCGLYTCEDINDAIKLSTSTTEPNNFNGQGCSSIRKCNGDTATDDGTYTTDEACKCNQILNCNICNNNNGCDQCIDGYFKKDNCHQCELCDNIFNANCIFCQDFNGCGKCKSGCNRFFNTQCNLWDCDCS